MKVPTATIFRAVLVSPAAPLAAYFCLSTMLAVIAALTGVPHLAYWMFAWLLFCLVAYLPRSIYAFHVADAALGAFLAVVLWSWLATGQTGGWRTIAYIASSIVIPWVSARVLQGVDIERFLRYVTAFGALVCLLYLAAVPLLASTDPWERVMVFGGVAYGVIGPTVGLLAVVSAMYLAQEESVLLRIMLVLCVVAVIHMGARGMFVALVLTTLISTGFLQSGFRRKLSVLATVIGSAAIAAMVIPQARLHHFLRLVFEMNDPTRSINDTTSERLGLYGEAFHLFTSHPIAGVGVGRFGIHSSLNAALTTPHSTLLHVISELGLVGGLPFLTLNAVLAVLAVNAIRTNLLCSILAGCWIYFALYDQISANYLTSLRYYLFAALLVAAAVNAKARVAPEAISILGWKRRERALGGALRTPYSE